MGEFRDHPSKQAIRKYWGKPLIEFLHNTLSYKFIYLGLPGPQALDLLEWINFIDEVIAFQCRDYPRPSSISQPTDKVKELEDKLRELERQGKLATYSVYDGYIEEVILRDRDIVGNAFRQHDIVTIYNLDFCNSITSPLQVMDDRGELHRYYKSQSIRKLLEIQRDIQSVRRCKKFVMFLTIHSYFQDKEMKRFMYSADSGPVQRYLAQVNSLKKKEDKRARQLKAYIFDVLKGYLCNCEFTPEFLPVFVYKGVGPNLLLLFTIAGVHDPRSISKATVFQKPSSFLDKGFLTVQDGAITQSPCPGGFSEKNSLPDPVKNFSSSASFKYLWT